MNNKFRVNTSAIVKIISQDNEFDWFNPHRMYDSYSSSGTGFFYNNKGYILTCAHVVMNGVRHYITVPEKGKERYEVELVSSCPTLDIAILRSKDYTNKSYLELGDSDNAHTVEQVSVVGYPLGVDSIKQTIGVISGVQEHFIQTDASINPGNSGGPLINETNQVIGINTAKIEKADNIGYSTPINLFKIMQVQMENSPDKIIYKPELLCRFNTFDDTMIRFYQNPAECMRGYGIRNLFPNSPFYVAGMMKGDVLCSFDGNKIDYYGEAKVWWNDDKVHIESLLKRKNVGDVVKATYWSIRKKQMFTTDVKLDLYEPFKVRMKYPTIEKIDYVIFAGMILMELSLNHYQNFQMSTISNEKKLRLTNLNNIWKRQKSHIICTNIIPGSTIMKKENIEPGDIITHINKTRVRTLDDFRKEIVRIPTHPNGKFISILTLEEKLEILDVLLVIKEEPKLSRDNNFPLSPLWFELKEKTENKAYTKKIENIKHSMNQTLV